jgi:hypothetical protein
MACGAPFVLDAPDFFCLFEKAGGYTRPDFGSATALSDCLTLFTRNL